MVETFRRTDCHENDGCKAEPGEDDVRVVQLSAFLRKSSYVAVLKDINLSIPLRKVPTTFTPPLFDDRFSTEAS